MNTIFSFLKKLKKNNNRVWFKTHKDEYDKARAEFAAFLTVLIAEIGKFDKSVRYLEPQDTMFRIYRDGFSRTIICSTVSTVKGSM